MEKEFLAQVVERHKRERDIFSILKEVQGRYGFISEGVMRKVAEALGVPVGEVYGVATFYSFLSTRPMGKHVVMVCRSLPCWLKGSGEVIEALKREREGSEEFSLLVVNCIGACDVAPAMLVDGKLYGNLTPQKAVEIVKRLREEPCRRGG